MPYDNNMQQAGYGAAAEALDRIRRVVQDRLSYDIASLPTDATDETVRNMIVNAVSSIVQSGQFGNVSQEDFTEIVQKLDDEFLGFGPIEPLLADESISEIMVNGGGFDENGIQKPSRIFIERSGKVSEVTNIKFDSEDHVVRIMNRIVGQMGRHLDQANPIEDASLPDGSRFSGTVFPISPDGSSFNIRKFQQDRLGYQDLINIGTFTLPQMQFLASAIMAKCSILISGGTGSGKTTLLNVLGGFIPADERLVTIEDTCELLLHKNHADVTRLQARKANSEGSGEVTLNDLLVNTLRRRPDRIIVGECRGPEAYTMLEAMNTGHEGSMTTIHANDPVSALTRLVTLVKQGDDGLSENTIKQKVADALDLVVQVQRLADGTRKCTSIQAIGGYSDGVIQHDELWSFVRTGKDANGFFTGHHQPSGLQPAAVRKKIENAGLVYNINWLVEGSPEMGGR